MNKKNLLLFLLATLMPLASQASSYDWARVVDVRPVYERVRVPTSYRQCDDVDNYYRHRRHVDATSSAIAGGIIGGVIGNQFGKGRGRDAATVAGAMLGASIGHNAARAEKHRYRHRHDESCRVRDRYEDQVIGYDVSYKYHGEVYHARMAHHPGKRVRVKVRVSLAE